MANYICPVCGKNCGNLKTLNVCVSQHIENEEKENKEKAQKILEMKRSTIQRKSEELAALVKEFNELPDNPFTVTYTAPSFIKKRTPVKKNTNTKTETDININKKDADDKKEMDFDQMLDDLYGRAKKSSTFSKDEAEKFEKDLDDCLGALLGSLFRS